MHWTPWIPLNAETPWNPRWGIYRVRLMDSSGVRVPIPRIGSVDPEGVLYIGRSGYSHSKTDRSLGRRLWEFYNHGSHSGAGTWWQVKAVLDLLNRWPGRTLEVSVVELPDALIDDAESQALREYFSAFGELPPCNSSFPGKWTTFVA